MLDGPPHSNLQTMTVTVWFGNALCFSDIVQSLVFQALQIVRWMPLSG
jgi:hypothetical protein